MNIVKERFLDAVVPTRWEQHVTDELQEKYDADGKPWYHPASWVPPYVKIPVALAEGLIRNEHRKERKSSVRIADNDLKRNLKMPNKKPKQKKKKQFVSKKKKNKKGNMKTTSIRMTGRSPVKPVLRPPLTSYVRQLTNYPGMSFSSGAKPGCVVATFKQRLGNIVWRTDLADPDNGITVPGFAIAPDASNAFDSPYNTDTVLPMNLGMRFYNPWCIRQFCGLFRKFRIKNYKINYNTASGTNLGTSIIMAYTEDPDYLESNISFPVGGQSRNAWYSPLLGQIPGSVQKPVWNNFSFNVPFVKEQKWYYTSNDYPPFYPSDTSIPFSKFLYKFGTPNKSAEDRDTFQGMFYLGSLSSVASGFTNNAVAGSIEISITIELCDMGSFPMVAQATVVPPTEEKILDVSEMKRFEDLYKQFKLKDSLDLKV